MQSMVGKSLQAVAYGDKVQTSRSHSLPFHVEQAEAVDELEQALKGWAKEAFRVLPLNLKDDLPDVDSGQGAVEYMRHRLDDLVGLPFIAEIHDELIPLIRAGLKRTGQERMPLEALDAMCPICLERTTQVDWVGDDSDPQLLVTCKKCRLVIDGGTNGNHN
ncbi:Hypotetical protein [Gulosibacter molinativorax]|nr:Hypotetical protein [Gulosibacter molinativorax]